MRRNQPFKRHRFPSLIILSAVRMYLRYPLSYQDVADLLGERDKAIERVRLHRPVSICTDKAPTHRKVIRDINHRYDPHFDYITHIDKKYRNNRVESDHAALKRLLGYRQSFRSLRCAKATLRGMETIRTIKNGHIQNRQLGVRGEVAFVSQLFGLAA